MKYKLVVTQKLLIHGIAKGLSQYAPLQNEGAYYGLCNLTIHSAIIDYRYRIIPSEVILASRKEKQEGKQVPKLPVLPPKPKTLGDFLFSNADGSMPAQVRASEVDKIYSDYVKVLMANYEQIKEKFLDIQKRCLSDKQKRDHCILLMCQDMILPGDEGDEELFALQDDLPPDFENLENEEIKQKDPQEVDEEQSRQKTEHEEVSECNITNEISQLENYKKLEGESKKEEKKEVARPHPGPEESFMGCAGDMDEQATNKIIVPSFKPNQRSVLDTPSANTKGKPKFSLKTSSQDPYKCAAKFALNITLISGQIIELWHKYIELITITPRFVTEMLS